MASNDSDFGLCSSCSGYSDESEYFSSGLMNSTPSRRGLSDSCAFTVEAMKPYVRRDLEERFASNEIDIAQFVKVVWGLDEKDVCAITEAAREGKISFPNDILHRYKHILCEKEAYGPFLTLAEHIFNQTCDILSYKNNRYYPVILYESKGETVLKSRHSQRKPDALALPTNYDRKKRITWKDVLVPFEFKTVRAKGKILFPDGSTQRIPTPKVPEIRSLDSDIPHNLRGGPREKRSYPVNLNSPVIPAHDSVEGQTQKESCSKADNLNDTPMPFKEGSLLKRRVDDDSDLSPYKRQRTSPRLTEAQLQLARYALECMAASSRHYVTGVFVDGFNVSLWYYDRAIVACTSFFNFEKDIGKLALIIYAIRACDLRHAGFDSFIIPPSDSPPSNLEELFRIPPSMIQTKGDEIVLFPKDDVCKRFRIDDDGVLFANKGVVGRGTVVFSVEPVVDDSTSEGKHVVKILWRQKKRKEESDIIQQLRKAIPEMAQHLPEITAFVSVTASELNLPRQLLGLSYDDDWERELLMIAMKRYKGLWYANDVDEFKDLFVDCVECHYAAFRRGRVLHRDLSVDNLMCVDGLVSSRKTGIVSDWDLSSFIDDKDEIILSHTTHRTGTVPFMSKELLNRNPPAHKYWHDLESFLYILFWAAVHFDLENHTILSTHERLKSWNNDDLEICFGLKGNFLFSWEGSCYRDIVRRQNKGLEGWLTALRKLFSGTYLIVLAREEEILDPSTYAKVIHRPVELFEEKITFQSFMAAIGRQPRFLYA